MQREMVVIVEVVRGYENLNLFKCRTHVAFSEDETCERKRGSKEESKGVGPHNQKNAIAVNKDGKDCGWGVVG